MSEVIFVTVKEVLLKPFLKTSATFISNYLYSFDNEIVTYFHFANLLNVGHAFRGLALLLICLVMTLNMLIHNTTTDHSNGMLWNLKSEKIFLKSQGLTK